MVLKRLEVDFMDSKNDTLLKRLFAYIEAHSKAITAIGVIIMLPLVYLFVYYTGGIKYVYSHTMYIPILLAGIILGAKYGVLTAFVAGILLGPLMPIDTTLHEPQLFINWFYRMMIFILMGFISGYASTRLRKNARRITELMSFNQETMIPNTNFLTNCDRLLEPTSQSIITILVTNHQSIIDVLGTEIFYRLMKEIYTDLLAALPKRTMIVQSDSNKLWVIKAYEDLSSDAEMVLNIINHPRVIDNIPLYVDYSLGVGMQSDWTRCKKMSTFKTADASARYAAIRNLPYVVFDDTLIKRRQEYELLAVFSKALAEDQTFLVYQPKIDLKTMKPIGLEALIRWRHPTKGMIMPDNFIPIVEQTKLIHSLTDWVFRKALQETLECEAEGLDIEISVNISAKNLYDDSFFARTMAIIEEMKVPKDKIEIEITESVLMINPDESKVMLDSFVAAGIRIAIDDFGKGYSSLAYLSQFPIDVIKIDKFFMRQIVQNTASQQIVKATIDLAKKLGYKVLAEGVEDKNVMDLIMDFHCDQAQGYYFARPMDKQTVIEWFKEHSAA